MLEVCENQKVNLDAEAKQRALLDQPNERYLHLKMTWQRAKIDKMDLDELKNAMHEDDADHQRSAAPAAGSVARVEEDDIDKIISDRLAQA